MEELEITLETEGDREQEISLMNESSGSEITDYNALSNKPKINNVELLGNKTLEELGIQSLPRINEQANTSTGITLVDNTIYRFINFMDMLALGLPSTINELFQCEVVFMSGTTPTSLTYDNSIKWSGDDIKDNVFVPVANKTYNILFWYDGFNMNAVARGV